MIDIKIPMKPIAKGRPKFTKTGHCYTPNKTRKAEKDIGIFVKMEMSKNGIAMSEGPIIMQLEFCFEGKKPFHLGKPDLDNLIKICKDSCQNIIYKNDSQVVKLEASKIYGEEDYIHIKAKEIV